MPTTAPDLPAAEAAIVQLLTALGQDVESPELTKTPARTAAALAELIAVDSPPVVAALPAEGYRGLVLVREIPFQSLCEHHLLPFRGVAHVGFLPDEKLVGVSTLARGVDHFAHGLLMQERMTGRLLDWLDAELAPRGAGVVVEAEHLCMSFRGVGTPETRLVTSAFSGALESDPGGQAAFFGGRVAPAEPAV